MKAPLSPAIWALPLILVAAAVVFAPALGFQFVFDDRYQVAQNPSITSWSYLPLYFRSHVWGYAGGFTNYYRPIFLIVLRIWNSVVGLDPVGWHVLPVIVHLINVGLVFALVRRLTRDDTTGLIAAALFGVHPIQIEAVGSIYGITDAIMAVFLLGSFLVYLRWKQHGGSGFLAISAALFACALLTKESAVVFPVVIAAFEFVRGRNANSAAQQPHSTKGTLSGAPVRRHAVAAVIAVALLVTYFLARRLALGTLSGHVASGVSWTITLLTAPLSLGTFLRLWIAPFGMSSFYDSPYVTSPDLHFLLPLLLLIAIVVGIWLWSRRTRERLILFSAIWAVLAVAPVLDIRLMQPSDFVHIRFLYVPSIALSLLAAIALRQLFSNAKLRATVTAALVIALAVSTRAQIGFLHDNDAMYLRGIAVAPGNPLPANNLADDYVHAGRIDEAAALLDDNLRRHPDYWMSNYNRGYIAYTRQNWPEVAEYMNRAIANGATETDAYVYRALALLKMGRPQEAERSVRQAIAIRPKAQSYHFVLGLVLRQEQRWDDALAAFQQELAVDPSNHNAAVHVADLRTRLHK